jgi:hypothetical protein
MVASEVSKTGMRLKIAALVLMFAMTVTALAPLASSGEAAVTTGKAPAMMGFTPSAMAASVVEPAPMAVPDPVDPDTIVVQPNASVGKDTWIGNETTQYENSGKHIYVYFGSNGMTSTDKHKGLFQFVLPSNPIAIKSATFSLYMTYIQSPGTLNVTVNPITSYWDEGTGTAFSGEGGYANWWNRTNGTAWSKPGGDFDNAFESYQGVSTKNTWYHWNVTDIAQAWISGQLVNNGLLVNATPFGAPNYLGVYSSDDANPLLWPKLTISYGASIDTPVLAQSLQEDEAARIIPLTGRGSGTIDHLTGPDEAMSNGMPFWGATANQMRDQYLYNSSQVGAEGVIRRISFNRTSTIATGTFNAFSIRLAHTSLTALTTTFNSNYNGYLTEVFPIQNIFVNTSNNDRWIHFDLNGNFTYDSQYNLIVDIVWTGDGGTNVGIRHSSIVGRQCYDIAGAATGAVQSILAIAKFSIDAVDNAVYSNGGGGNFFPFVVGQPAMRMQLLYNKSYINQSGVIASLDFQSFQAGFKTATFNGLSIRLAHSVNSTLDNSFNLHNVGAWVEVFNKSSYALSTVGLPEWMRFDINNTFTYNGINNLLIDIRWMSSSGTSIALAMNQTFAYNTRAVAFDYSAVTATQTNPYLYFMRATFADSVNLTWSATSSAPTIFTAGVSGRSLVITPQLNQYGTGHVTLTLRNSNGITVAQQIPVTITAVNDAPVLGALYNLQCVEDVPRTINIAANITDVDDPIANISVSTNSTYAVVIGKNITFNYPQGILGESVLVTVTDRLGLTDTQVIATSVTMVNDKPYFTSFVNTLVCDATVPKTYVLHTADEETPGNLTISASSSHATLSGTTVTFTYPKGIGSELVQFHLSDKSIYGSKNNVTYFLNVTIVDHPEVVDNTPTGANVTVTSPIVVTFDATMNQTKAQNAFSLKLGTTPVNGTFSWSADGKVMTFTPSTHMTNGKYFAAVSANAENVTGVKMLNAFAWNFNATLGSFDGDGDGMPDQYEMDNGLDPNVDDAQGDADGDGMPNLYEYQNDLDPQVNDAGLDADGDGATNLEEYEAETDPNDPNDKPAAEMGWLPILMAVVIIAVVAAVVLWLVMGRKKKQAPAQPGQQTAYQELRELRPEVPQDQPPQGQPAPSGPEQPPQGGQPPAGQ